MLSPIALLRETVSFSVAPHNSPLGTNAYELALLVFKLAF